MNEDLHDPELLLFWGPRKESRQACAERMLRYLEVLKDYDGLGQWFLLGRTREEANTPLDTTFEGIMNQYRALEPDTPDGVTSYSFNVWNGDDEKSASMYASCGETSEWVKNMITLELPWMPWPPDATQLKLFEELTAKTAEVWEVEIGGVTSEKFKEFVGEEIPLQQGGKGLVTYHAGKIEIHPAFRGLLQAD